MSNVKAINGALIPGEPDSDVVEKLELMLAKAKSGELKAIAIAAITTEGSATTTWQHRADKWALTGAVSWLHQRLLTE